MKEEEVEEQKEEKEEEEGGNAGCMENEGKGKEEEKLHRVIYRCVGHNRLYDPHEVEERPSSQVERTGQGGRKEDK